MKSDNDFFAFEIQFQDELKLIYFPDHAGRRNKEMRKCLNFGLMEVCDEEVR